MTEEATRRFGELVARPDSEVPLDEAAALIGAHAEPGLDVARPLARLDELAAGCPEPTLEALCQHLFAEEGFTGNREDYGDPANSYLHEVLERRTGIPISLSVVTLEVGRRLGLPLAGVGMPAHFLVRHDPPGEAPTFLDPFDGGARLETGDCEAIWRILGGTGSFDPAWLDPVGPRAILNRMLTNLQAIFVRTDLRSARWVLRLRTLIPGLGLPEQLGLARALASLGQFAAAGAALEGAAGSAPPEEADRLRAQARAMRARNN